jgi:hypothetical protein
LRGSKLTYQLGEKEKLYLLALNSNQNHKAIKQLSSSMSWMCPCLYVCPSCRKTTKCEIWDKKSNGTLQRAAGETKGAHAFSNILGFVSEAGEKRCPTSEIFKEKDYI